MWKFFRSPSSLDIYPLFNGGLTVYQENVHDYMGVEINYSEKVMVNMLMVKCLDNLIEDSPENLGATAAAPAVNYMFKIRGES